MDDNLVAADLMNEVLEMPILAHVRSKEALGLRC
jgi:hypothetical protein